MPEMCVHLLYEWKRKDDHTMQKICAVCGAVIEEKLVEKREQKRKDSK